MVTGSWLAVSSRSRASASRSPRAPTSGPVINGPDGSERFGLELETVIDRTEFGLNWNMELPNGEPALANDVRLVVSLELVREEA